MGTPVNFAGACRRSLSTASETARVGNTLMPWHLLNVEPKVVVLGGGSWGTTVASICARRGPTLQWVRSEETANDINEKHRNTKYLGDEVELALTLQATTDFSEAADCADVIVMGVPSHGFRGVLTELAKELRPWVPVVSLGEGSRAGHELPDEPDRRRGAARPSGGHPGRAEHRPRGRRGVCRRGSAGHAGPAAGGQSCKPVPHHSDSGHTPPTTWSASRWPAR